MNKNPWKTLSSKTVFKNPYYQIRRDEVTRPNGENGTYDVLETPGAVFIVALDDDGKFPLIGQFRYTSGEYSMELPAGGRQEGSRDPIHDARRELLEETGLTAREWSEIARPYSCNGLSNEQMVVFIARDLKQTADAKHEEEGITEIKKVSFNEAFDMIKTGHLTDGQTITALAYAALYLGKI